MRKLVVVGCDPRDRYVAKIAERQGWKVWPAGEILDPGATVIGPSFPEGASLLGPVTGINGDGGITTEQGEIRLDHAVFQKMAGGFCAAGIVAPPIRRLAEDRGIHVVSYRESEFFAWQNAVLTAEGAIQATIGSSGYGLYRRPVGVLGYGRVGRALSQRLRLLVDASTMAKATGRSPRFSAHRTPPASSLGNPDGSSSIGAALYCRRCSRFR